MPIFTNKQTGKTVLVRVHGIEVGTERGPKRLLTPAKFLAGHTPLNNKALRLRRLLEQSVDLKAGRIKWATHLKAAERSLARVRRATILTATIKPKKGPVKPKRRSRA